MCLDHDSDPTSFALQTRVVDDRPRTTVVVKGQIDYDTAPGLTAALATAMDISPSIEVDLRATTFMDSSGLAALIAAHRRLAKPAALILVDPSKPVRRILTLSGVETLFTVSAT